MVFWEVLVWESQKYFANVGLHVGAKPLIKPQDVSPVFSSFRRSWCEFDIVETAVFNCVIVDRGSFIKALFITWNIRYPFTDHGRN